jgi:hypothetical protein
MEESDMKICVRISSFIIILFLIFYLSDCTSSSESKPQVISFADVWISNEVDADADNFYSYYRLNIDLDVSRNSAGLFVQVGVRVYDPLDTASYFLYMESEGFSIDGSIPDDAFFIAIGSPNTELPEGSFDFLIWVFKQSDRENPILELASHNDDNFGEVLSDIPIEESSTDAVLTIYDAYFDQAIDVDGDGYASQADLIVDVDVNLGRISTVFLAIYQKISSSSSYSLWGVTETFTVEGFSDDARAITVNDLPKGIYDFRIEAYYDVGHYSEASDEALSNPELNDVELELAVEDGWIYYDDGYLENEHSYINPSYYAVRFNKPADVTSCIIREIYLYVTYRDTTISYAQFKIWTSVNNTPGTEIWGTGNVFIGFDGDNYYHPVDVDVSTNNVFFVGFFQINGYGFYLGGDATSPDLRSYFAASRPISWDIISNSDYCIRIYIEYATSLNKKSMITRGEWIDATFVR